MKLGLVLLNNSLSVCIHLVRSWVNIGRVVFTVWLVLQAIHTLHAQDIAPQKRVYSLDAGLSLRLLEQMPLELNLMLTHENGYGFQLGVLPGFYTAEKGKSSTVDNGEYSQKLGVRYPDLFTEISIAAIALRPSFYLVKTIDKVSVVNGLGLNYCYSKTTLTTRDQSTLSPRAFDDIIEYNHTIAMEFYVHLKYYLKSGRMNLSATALAGMNAEPMNFLRDKVPMSKPSNAYQTGQGYAPNSSVYFNFWLGIGYKFIQ